MCKKITYPDSVGTDLSSPRLTMVSPEHSKSFSPPHQQENGSPHGTENRHAVTGSASPQ